MGSFRRTSKRPFIWMIIVVLTAVLAFLFHQSIFDIGRYYQNEFWRIKYALLDNSESVVYKQTREYQLKATFLYPASEAGEEFPRPVIVYFFGGGWRKGSINQFYSHARHFNDQGFVGVLVDYRVHLRHNSTPEESVEDARDFMRYLSRNSDRFKLDTTSVFLCGASAGGQLALSTTFEGVTDALLTPKGLLLYTPVLKTTKGGYAHEVLGEERASLLSPLQNLHKSTPPSLIFYGNLDKVITVEQVAEFKAACDSLGVRTELFVLPNKGHVYPKGDLLMETIEASERFLESIKNKTKE